MVNMAADFRYFFAAILNPFFIGFMLLAISIAWLFIAGDRRLVRVGLLLSLIIFLILGTGWLPARLVAMLEQQYAIVSQANPDVHWIVVLGGGHNTEHAGVPPNDLLSSESMARLVEGVRLYRQLPQAKLLLSGGAMRPMETIAEATYLANIVSWFDIPKRDVVLETDSFNTADEAEEIEKIVHTEPCYLVTSAIHMPRAMALFRQQGLHPIAAPTDNMLLRMNDNRWEDNYLPNARNMLRTQSTWHEVLGLIWGKCRGLL